MGIRDHRPRTKAGQNEADQTRHDAGTAHWKDEARMSEPKGYYRLMLGAKSKYAEDCFKDNFVGADFSIEQDLTNDLPEHWRDFNKKVPAGVPR